VRESDDGRHKQARAHKHEKNAAHALRAARRTFFVRFACTQQPRTRRRSEVMEKRQTRLLVLFLLQHSV
jgi:hypothetical protein